MKGFKTFILAMVTMSMLSLNVFASDLDSVINQANTGLVEEVIVEQVEESESTEQSTDGTVEGMDLYEGMKEITNNVTNKEIIDEAYGAVDLKYSEKAAILNEAIGKATGFVIQIIAYCIICFLGVNTLIDMMYIIIPVSRFIFVKSENNGIMSGSMNNMSTTNSGGQFTSVGGSSFNQNGLYNGNQLGGTANVPDKSRFVSPEALNAVANSEYGKPAGALRAYTKDLVIKSVLVAVLLTLILSGVLIDFGFVIGDLIVNLISGVKGNI